MPTFRCRDPKHQRTLIIQARVRPGEVIRCSACHQPAELTKEIMPGIPLNTAYRQWLTIHNPAVLET